VFHRRIMRHLKRVCDIMRIHVDSVRWQSKGCTRSRITDTREVQHCSRKNTNRTDGVSLAGIVREYQQSYRDGLHDQLKSFRQEDSLRDAIERAAHARRPDGKRYDHQRRILRKALDAAASKLASEPAFAQVSTCEDFEALHHYIVSEIGSIEHIGPLMIYDTALRIGAKLGLRPTRVYLHQGARLGAKALGLNYRRPHIERSEFPPELQSLDPCEIEDCLCIFKKRLNLRKLLYARLRQRASHSSVPKSLPVLFFGDLFTAHVATVGLNPSDREYVDKQGLELEGAERRFETLTSLHATDRPSLTDEQCDRAIQTMREYYQPGKPIYTWFRPLARVTSAMGFSYAKGEVAHLDLAQEATKPTWSRLSQTSPAEFDALRSTDLPFLRWLLEESPLHTVICNGRTVIDEVCRLIGGQITKKGKLQRITWYIGKAALNGRTIWLAGWNIPLAHPTGLGAAGEQELGRILTSQCPENLNELAAPAIATCVLDNQRRNTWWPDCGHRQSRDDLLVT